MNALLFTIDDRKCTLPLDKVAEVVPSVNIDAVPGAPPLLEGVVNVRGEILPVLSLRVRLGHVSRPVSPSEYFIIAKARTRRVIFRSDTVPLLFDLSPLTQKSEEGVERAIAGVVALPDGVALVLDVDDFVALADEPMMERALSADGKVS